jgi:hypothetical protein
MTFWEMLWFVFISYAFIAYLILLFHIIVDVFRDHELSGIAKAGWSVFLILLPFIAAIVYLIARGKGLSRRQQAYNDRQVSAQEAYIRSVAGSQSTTAHVAEAKSLLDSGAITESEYETLKRNALA